jgi:hypothetical protein
MNVPVLNAATENTPSLRYLPPLRTQEAMLTALARIGLLPHGKATANGVDILNASGVQFSVFEVDQALKKNSTLDVSQRLQFKRALDHAGLLKDR